MSPVEQPDRIGRSLLVAVVFWAGLGVLIFAAFKFVFPVHASLIEHPGRVCTASVPTGPFAFALADPARAIVTTPSRCVAAPHGDRTAELLHAYLEGAELESSPREPRPTLDAPLRAHGGELYQVHCASCHGATGNGAGPDACAIDTQPAVHNSGVFSLRTTEHEALPTDEDLFRTITRGVHGTAMPPWFALPERDRWALVAYVKSLSKAFDEDTAPPPMDNGTPPTATPERLAAGADLYVRGGCASCHGVDGDGNGAAAASLRVKPRDFTAGRFQRGSTAADIHETLMTGLDGTPMASFASVLTADQLWDVTLYVHGLAPLMIDRGDVRCPRIARGFDPQELFGVRSMLHSLPPNLRSAAAAAQDLRESSDPHGR